MPVLNGGEGKDRKGEVVIWIGMERLGRSFLSRSAQICGVYVWVFKLYAQRSLLEEDAFLFLLFETLCCCLRERS